MIYVIYIYIYFLTSSIDIIKYNTSLIINLFYHIKYHKMPTRQLGSTANGGSTLSSLVYR